MTNDVAKEIRNACIEFEKLDIVTPDDMMNGNINPGYEHVNMNMIFDIKMDGKFNRKAILVADGHTTSLSSSITY